MINFLSSWVKNLSFALIIVSILEMILPNNKTKKYIKTVMGLYILFSIIAPIIENNDKFNINNLYFDMQDMTQTSTEIEEVDQTSMKNRLNQIYEEQLQKDIIQKVEEQGYKAESCKVKAHISENDSGIENIDLKIESKINNENNEQSEENINGETYTSQKSDASEKINANQKSDTSENINVNQKEDTIESKIVTEIQKIPKIEIGKKENNQDIKNNKVQEDTKITNTDIQKIKNFLKKEYEVNEKCLKIN